MSDEYYHTKASVDQYIEAAKDVNSKQLIEKLREFLPAKSHVLEIGSGPGTDWQLLKQNFDVIGSDNSEEFLKHLRSTHTSSEFLLLDASTLETEKIFDGIYSNKVLHHLTDEALQDSIYRQKDILQPAGIVCHSFWKGEGSEDFKGMFVNYHTAEELRKLFETHFEVLVLKEYKEFEDGDSLLLIGRKK